MINFDEVSPAKPAHSIALDLKDDRLAALLYSGSRIELCTVTVRDGGKHVQAVLEARQDPRGGIRLTLTACGRTKDVARSVTVRPRLQLAKQEEKP